MEQSPRFSSLGRQFRRMFIAFILSQYIVFLQVWLGIELFKLAKELERAGKYHEIKEFEKCSILFLGARVAAFAAFIMGLISYVSTNLISYRFIHDLYTVTFIIPYIKAIPIVIELGILIAAWKRLHHFFECNECSSSHSIVLGLRSTARVKWALGVTIAATIINVVASARSGYDIYGFYPSYYTIYYIVPTILTFLGGVLFLLGTINAGVGLYDTSRTFLYYGEIHVKKPSPERIPERDFRVRPSRETYRELPFHPENLAAKNEYISQDGNALVSEDYNAEIPIQQEKMKYCYNCGLLLPEVAGLRFCPICGIRVD